MLWETWAHSGSSLMRCNFYRLPKGLLFTCISSRWRSSAPFCPSSAREQSLPSPSDSPFSFPRSTRRSWRTWRTSSTSPTSATPSGCTAGARRIPMMTPRSWGSSRCDSPFHTWPGARSSVCGCIHPVQGNGGNCFF